MQLASDGIGQADFKTVQSLIYQYAGISLSDAKHVMVHSRLAKRLREYRFSDYAEYLQFLQSPDGAEERVHFINCLTTNKTDFFSRESPLRVLEVACISRDWPPRETTRVECSMFQWRRGLFCSHVHSRVLFGIRRYTHPGHRHRHVRIGKSDPRNISTRTNCWSSTHTLDSLFRHSIA